MVGPTCGWRGGLRCQCQAQRGSVSKDFVNWCDGFPEPLEKVVNSKGTTWKYPKQFNASRDFMRRFRGQRDKPKWGNVPIHPRIALPLLAGCVMSTWKWFVPISTVTAAAASPSPKDRLVSPQVVPLIGGSMVGFKKNIDTKGSSISIPQYYFLWRWESKASMWTGSVNSTVRLWISPPLPPFFSISPWTTIYVGYCWMMCSFIVIICIGSCGSQVLTPWKTTPSLTANTCVAVALQHNGSSWHIAPCGTPLYLRATSNGGRCCGDVCHVSSVRKTEYIHDSPCHHAMTWCQPI